jgi:hypothetical protein
MKVGWLIDADMFPHYRDELVKSIRAQGHEARLIRAPQPPYRWDDVGCSYRETFLKDACVVAHGDIELVHRVVREGRWTPGAFATIEHFFCSNYYSHFSDYLLNRDYVTLPFEELPGRREVLFDTFGRGARIFVRPDSPLKLFTGQVVSRETFDADYEFMGFYEFPTSSMVIVSCPQEIETEWRFVVADRRVIAGCQYKNAGAMDAQPQYDSAAFKLATQIASSEYQPDPVWVMDICKTSDDAYHLLEIGGFSFADLYACDQCAIVAEVSKIALAAWQRKRN